MKRRYITKSEKETILLGKEFARSLKPGACVCLAGDLGTGKTTFIKGLAEGLGLDGKKIISSSFILAREYPEKKFVHMDVYRIAGPEFLGAGLDQYLDGRNICAIEWAENVESILAANKIEVRFTMTGRNEREIAITRVNKSRGL